MGSLGRVLSTILVISVLLSYAVQPPPTTQALTTRRQSPATTRRQSPATTRRQSIWAPDVVAALPPGVGVDVSYEPTPAVTTDSELDDSSLGRVRPVGRPIRLHVTTEDAQTGTRVALDQATGAQSVPLHLPVIGPPLQPDGEFTWLAEVRQNGQFVGYRRLSTSYDASTNTLQTTLSLAELDDTLMLPVVLIPTFAQVVDASAHLWSSSDAADATDFGTPGNPDVLLQVEGPNVAGKLYIYDPTTATHAWIDADALAAVDFAITP